MKYKKILKKVLFVLVNLVLMPDTFFYQLSNGLDPSWFFALNYIQTGDKKFGKDYFFTYGPLGFLGRCQYIGNNLYIGIVFWILITMIQIYLLKCLFRKQDRLVSLALASMLIIFASPVHEADIYLCYLEILAILLVYKYKDFYSQFISVFLSGVIFLYKFSGTILLFTMLFMLIACVLFEKEHMRMIGVVILNIIAGPVCYLFYDPSVKSLIQYVRASIEISSGYNLYMTIDTYRAYFVWVILLVVCYLVLMLYGFIHKKTDLSIFFILAPACFVWYKEGFVRNDGHYVAALTGMLLIGSVLFFFIDWKLWFEETAISGSSRIPLYTLILLAVIPVMGKGQTLSAALQQSAYNVFNLPKSVDDCKNQDFTSLQEHNQAFMDIIGNDTYTTFPWEITENISYDNQNFLIAPFIQNYTVYTPYLDRVNAEFYAEGSAPEYIIMYLNTIDERWPLIETPVTWEKIYQNYSVIASDEEKFLLKKRNHVLEKKVSECSLKPYKIDETIEIPEGCNVIKLDTKLGKKGTLIKLFNKILPVNMRAVYSDGSEKTGRVVQGNLSEGIDLNSLVWDNEDFINYMNRSKRDKSVVSITLTGEGLKQYEQIMHVSFCPGGWE